jgi:4'-phosphopantetheinyl transferase EntD
LNGEESDICPAPKPHRGGKIIAKFDKMPIFFQQDIDNSTRLGIWKIEEEEGFFLEKVVPQRHVSHPHKNLQHLAGRYLLRYLFPSFPIGLIRIADTRKPFLEDEAYHFSLSHSGDYAAAIVSTTSRVGVDVEQASAKVAMLRPKFSSEPEWLRLSESRVAGSPDWQLPALIWSAKEAAFKWYGLGGVDFRNHMVMQSITASGPNSFNSIMQFKKNEDLYLGLRSEFFDRLCLSYVAT